MRALNELVRTYEGALAPEMCAHLVAEFHRLEQFQQRNGAGVRAGLESSAWYELDMGQTLDASTRDLLIDRIQQYHQRYNADLDEPRQSRRCGVLRNSSSSATAPAAASSSSYISTRWGRWRTATSCFCGI